MPGVKKVFAFNTSDDPEPMQAVEPDQPYKVSLNPRILSEYVNDFNAVMDEVTMIPQPEAFKVRCSQDSKDIKTKEDKEEEKCPD